MTAARTDTVWPHDVLTLAIDIGGSGFKASIVSAAGEMTTERLRVDTPYPCTPETLVKAVTELVAPLMAVQRVSVGFPGLVRHGVVIGNGAH